MEIEIQSKKNNQLLNRTEVHFIVNHKGEGTPNREIVRSELAEKLNVKKENVMVNYMTSDFGIQRTSGYAKVYTSVEKVKAGEQKHILKRNNVIAKEEKKKEEPSAEKPEAAEEKPEEEAQPTEQPAEEKKEEEETAPKQPSEASSEPEKTEEAPTPQEDKSEKTDVEEKPAEEKKEGT